MMSTPQPYPTVANNAPAPDDAQIESKMPSICVDYLSHDWTDEDVWSSWKAMTKQKDKIANGVRLENASWRTWAKQRGKLKTISPETLNWLKDSDVTWLYGPLHEHADPVPPPKQATTADRLDLDDGHGVRSILKHRTISELLTTPGRATSPGVELNMDPFDEHMEAQDKKADEERRALLFSVKSDSNLVGQNQKRSAGSPTGLSTSEEGKQPHIARTESNTSDEKRHISFNQRVEQCIALDRHYHDYDDYSEEEDDEVDGDETSEEEEVLTMKSSPRTSPSNAFTKTPEHPIIAKLAPTSLKTSETYPAPSPAVVDPTGFMSSQSGNGGAPIGSAASYSNNYGYAANVPGSMGDPTARGVQWDVDEDFSGDFEYFNGPDLTEGPGEHGADHDSGPVYNTGDASSSPDSTRSYTTYFDPNEPERDVSMAASTSPQQDYAAPTTTDAAQGGVASVGPRSILKKRAAQQVFPDDYDARSSFPEAGGDSASLASSHTDSTGSFGESGGEASRSERGRTSQRLGSSASYERIQEAARSSRTRSNSGGSVTSHSPNGTSVNGSYDDRYSAVSPSTSPNAHRGYNQADSDPSGDGRETFRNGGKEAQGNAGGEGRRFGDHGSSAGAGFGGAAGSGSKAGQAGSSAFRSAGVDSDSSDGHASYGLASPNFPASPLLDGREDDKPSRSSQDRDGDRFMYGDERSYWSDEKPSLSGPSSGQAKKAGRAPGTPSRTQAAGTQTTTAAALSVDTENVPSNAPASNTETGSLDGHGSIEVGPTPLNTPTFILSRASGKRRPTSTSSNEAISGGGPNSPTLPRRTSATGALVAPHNSEPRVPLAHDYVEEDEGGIVGRAVEIVNTARDLIGALLGTGDRGRSWREG
ncbi:protein phosphatase regulator [Thecaphora frezii]